MNLKYWLIFTPLAIAVILFWSLGGLSSCMKNTDAVADLGPEVEPAAIEQALSEATQDVTPINVREGQRVDYEVNYKILGTEPIKKVIDQTLKVVKVSNTTQALSIWRLSIVSDYSVSPPKTTETELPVDVYEKTPLLPQMLQSKSETQKLVGLELKRSEEDEPVQRYSYHNLTVRKNLVTDPPSDVTSKPGCGDVPNCSLRYTFIEFDEVAWFNETEFRKERLQLELSADTPFYGFIISKCNIYPVNTYRVRACQVLRNFAYR